MLPPRVAVAMLIFYSNKRTNLNRHCEVAKKPDYGSGLPRPVFSSRDHEIIGVSLVRALEKILYRGLRHPFFYFRPDGFRAVPPGLRF
jgi:hypothetical protein